MFSRPKIIPIISSNRRKFPSINLFHPIDRVSGAVNMDPEVKDKDDEIGVYFYTLPFIPPKEEKEEMSKEAKKDFYAMPKDAQDWYRQFKPALGEPEVDTRDPDDELLWFSKTPFEVVPNGKPSKLNYGLLFFKAKSHLDYHNISGVSEEEHEAWEDHLETLPPNTQRLIRSFMAPPKDIGQPSQGF